MSSEVKWIKIVTDIFDDEKIVLIESMPDADSIIVIWFKLLCLAGKSNNCGILTMNERIAYTDEMLAHVFRRPLNTIRLALKTFEQFGMIEIINDTIVIPNWEKHQNIDGMEKAREQARIRMARYRERQKLTASDVTQHVTSRYAADKEIDIDKDMNTSYPSDTSYSCAATSATPAKPPIITMPCVKGETYEISEDDLEKDKEAYPAVDVSQEYKRIKRWLETNKSNLKTKRGMPRFINNWLSREQNKGNKKGDDKADANNRGHYSGNPCQPRTVYDLKPHFAGEPDDGNA